MSDEYERAADEVRKLFQERGERISEDARASIIGEKIECDELKKALSYFMSNRQDFFRPSLLSLACEAVGGDPSMVALIGRTLILMSGAFDIHDDIIDKSLGKGGKSTIPGKFGNDIALLTGDALIFKGLAELFDGVTRLDIPKEKKLTIIRMMKGLHFELCDAEAMELGFKGRVDVKPEEYLYVVRKKAADVEAYLRLGAMLGGGAEEQVNALGEYGRLLGMMIILRDDLVDLLDFDGGLDLRIKNESLPLPILYALENDEKRNEIVAILQGGEIKGEKARELFEQISKGRGVSRLGELLKTLKHEATDSLTKIEKNKQIFLNILKAIAPVEKILLEA